MTEEDEDRADLVKAALAKGHVRSTGVIYTLCPFHHEKTASFRYKPTSRRYFCFGCHASGELPPDPPPAVLPGQLAFELEITKNQG